MPLTEPKKNVSVEGVTIIVPSGQFEQILLKTIRKSEKHLLEGIKKQTTIKFNQTKSRIRQSLMGMERQKYAFKVYQVWEVLVSPSNFD